MKILVLLLPLIVSATVTNLVDTVWQNSVDITYSTCAPPLNPPTVNFAFSSIRLLTAVQGPFGINGQARIFNAAGQVPEEPIDGAMTYGYTNGVFTARATVSGFQCLDLNGTLLLL